jgi:hypothetical protein
VELSGQLHVPADFLPEKEPPVPLGKEAVWAPEPVWTLWNREKISPDGNQTQVVQPVARLYIDGVIPNPYMVGKVKLSLYRPWRPLGLREVEVLTFSDVRLTDGGKVVSPTRRPLFTPRKFPGTHFC